MSGREKGWSCLLGKDWVLFYFCQVERGSVSNLSGRKRICHICQGRKRNFMFAGMCWETWCLPCKQSNERLVCLLIWGWYVCCVWYSIIIDSWQVVICVVNLFNHFFCFVICCNKVSVTRWPILISYDLFRWHVLYCILVHLKRVFIRFSVTDLRWMNLQKFAV